MSVGTWNVGGRAPHQGLDLSDWLLSQHAPSSPAHIYVLGYGLQLVYLIYLYLHMMCVCVFHPFHCIVIKHWILGHSILLPITGRRINRKWVRYSFLKTDMPCYCLLTAKNGMVVWQGVPKLAISVLHGSGLSGSSTQADHETVCSLITGIGTIKLVWISGKPIPTRIMTWCTLVRTLG